MQDWKTVQLGGVCQVEKTKHNQLPKPYVGLEDIESRTGRLLGTGEPQSVGSATFTFSSEHVLYGRLRPYLNKVVLPDFDGHCSSEIFPIRVGKQLNKRFLFYWLTKESTVQEINRTCTGARMPRANVNEVMKFDFPLPPLLEQQRIVAILDEAFAGIDAAVVNTEKNLESSRELFKIYLNNVFTKKGEGWVKKALGEIAGEVATGPFGSLLHKSDYVENGIPIVNPANIINGRIEPNFRKCVDQKTLKRLNSYVLKAGDIVVGRRGEIGRCAVVSAEQADWLCGTGSFVIRTSKSVNPDFIAHLIRSDEYRSILENLSTGATMKNLSNKSLSNLLISIPSLQEQERVLQTLDILASKTQRLEVIYQQNLDALSELKQSILQKAFSGELTQQEAAA